MGSAKLSTIVRYCDRRLQVEGFPDYEGAHNGLQVENNGGVKKVAAAVDATLRTIEKARAAGANLLVVHHGLFWGGQSPWTGSRYETFRRLLESDMAVYSAHLPLDAHPQLGNNARLCRALGMRALRPFFPYKDRPIGFQAVLPLPRIQLARRLEQATGSKPLLIPGGGSTCRRVGVVTGGAGSELKRAAAEGVDTFITGEGPHWTYALAEDLGINVLYGGHYATETFGVKALAAELSKKFRIPWAFIDHPTGL